MTESSNNPIDYRDKPTPNSDNVRNFYDSAAKNTANWSLANRCQSRIYYMRNLNNWIKSSIIGENLDALHEIRRGKPISVLDFCCGKGGDQMKFQKGRVDHVTFVDISAASIETCKERYLSLRNRNRNGHIFTADFRVHDCTTVLELDRTFDLVNCQFALHYAFESFTQARTIIDNVSSALKPGGYFIATLPNAYEIMRHLRDSNNKRSFGNSIYTVTFDEALEGDTPPPLFCSRYHFKLEGVVDCPEYLVYPPLLKAMCKEAGLDCLRGPLPFATQVQMSMQASPANFRLLSAMDALETWYPPSPRRESHSSSRRERSRSRSPIETTRKPLVGAGEDGAYEHVKRAAGTSMKPPFGTLSQPEWEAMCIYCVFVFQKKLPVE